MMELILRISICRWYGEYTIGLHL